MTDEINETESIEEALVEALEPAATESDIDLSEALDRHLLNADALKDESAKESEPKKIPEQEPGKEPETDPVYQTSVTITDRDLLDTVSNQLGTAAKAKMDELDKIDAYRASPEFAELERSNPGLCVAHQLKMNARERELTEQLRDLEPQIGAVAERESASEDERQWAASKTKIPEWEDRKIAQREAQAIGAFFKSKKGWSDAELDAVRNPDVAAMMRKEWLQSMESGDAPAHDARRRAAELNRKTTRGIKRSDFKQGASLRLKQPNDFNSAYASRLRELSRGNKRPSADLKARAISLALTDIGQSL